MSRSSHPVRRLFVTAALAVAVGAAACGGSRVTLNADEYAPGIKDQAGTYNGTHLYLVTPVNQAENTSVFYYYAADESVQYGGPALTSYLWYGLKKAFTAMGITVYERKPAFLAPELQLTFTSWTDREFTSQITLVSPRPFQRTMTVAFPSPPSAQATFEQRKAFAYRQVDTIVAQLLSDPEFQASYLAAQPPPGTVPQFVSPSPAPAPSTSVAPLASPTSAAPSAVPPPPPPPSTPP